MLVYNNNFALLFLTLSTITAHFTENVKLFTEKKDTYKK